MADVPYDSALIEKRADETVESPARRALRRLWRRKGAVAGLIVIGLFVTAAIGSTIAAYVIATLWIGNLRKQIASANPLARLSAEVQGATAPLLQIRFIFMQSLSGALIIAMWFAIAVGVAYVIR